MMTNFKVMYVDFNSGKPAYRDIIPSLLEEYKRKLHEDISVRSWGLDEFTKFVKDTAFYLWWGRCENEFLVVPWPPRAHDGLEAEGVKIGIADQVMENLDTVARIVMEEVKENDK